ncbi:MULTISPECIES: phytoene desaturase family protein [Bacillaceae]|uniref:phytoene desaturase family protein n=1 Tax=Bacillaceae TaxID=186817 RepID=UPI000BFE6C68|nr:MULTISPECIES: phytoene desaturase family protein [Bacillaceae]PGT91370.1 phytoene desaturase [Bacillus sp. AFS040349]UGB31755.1 phytoene desaturase [Metabacillus sp. B2-18]
MKKVVIIGAGLGGLAASISLAAKGHKVQIIEKNNHCGGKLLPYKLGSHQFDFGPNTITMPHIFKRVFEIAGEKSENYLTFQKLPIHTRNVLSNGQILDFTHDHTHMKEQLAQIDLFGAQHYHSFIKEITRLYSLSEKHFFYRTFQSWSDYVSPTLASALLRVRPFESLHHFFSRYFRKNEVIEAFSRYATYIGSSPYESPATFAMIAYLELVQGVYFIQGGNVQLAESYEQLAKKLGVEITLNTTVTKLNVENNKVTSILLADSEAISADEVIMNADLLKAYPELVEKQYRPNFSELKRNRYEPSISAFVILAGLSIRHSQLLHHNVFFSNQYKEEFQELFKGQKYSKNPSIYISNSSYTDPERSPDGDNLFILVNAPALGRNGEIGMNPHEYKEHIYSQLEEKGLSIKKHLVQEQIITPKDISTKFGAYRGSLYGLSSNKRKDAFLRPSNFSKDIRNLSFVGGSTHPGGGSPMVVISGLNVAEVLAKRL